MHSTRTTVFVGRDMAVVTLIWGVVQAMEQLHRCMGETLKYQASSWPVGTAEHFSIDLALMKKDLKVLSFLSMGHGHTNWTSWTSWTRLWGSGQGWLLADWGGWDRERVWWHWFPVAQEYCCYSNVSDWICRIRLTVDDDNRITV